MADTIRIQTAFRLPPELLERMKRTAKKRKVSLNQLVEQIIDRETRLELPKLPKDFKVSDEILQMNGCIKWGEPTEEELAADPKLAYLWEKYGKG